MNPTSMANERLCALAQKGDEAARELLVEKNMGFIVQTADLVYRSSSLEGSDLNIDVDDLVQEGSIGLLRAIDGFDPARKLKFLTYAAPAIKNAMLDLVHSQGLPVPPPGQRSSGPKGCTPAPHRHPVFRSGKGSGWCPAWPAP